MWKVSPKKTNRRWICARCLEKRVKGAPVKQENSMAEDKKPRKPGTGVAFVNENKKED